jgi:excisionase family DNA binding protein
MQRKNESKPVYPSVDALAAELGVSRAKVYTALNNGTIPAIRMGKRFILPRAAIQEWLRTAGSDVQARVSERG